MIYPMVNRFIKHLLIAFAFVSMTTLALGQATMYDKDIVDVPSTQRLVNDFAGMMSFDEVSFLENKLVQYEDTTSTQIAIVTVPTLGEYPVEEYGIRLARKWGIGSENDNGILILISEKERKFDIETGYGVGQYISDIDANRILREIMTPNFKNGHYFKGLDQATDRMILLLDGGFVKEAKKDNTAALIIFIIILIFFLIIIFSNKDDGNTTYTSSGRTTYAPPIFGGGFGGFSGGSGSSSGGFGGFGGGGFGGGGASGGW